MASESNYKWDYISLGGVVRVKIASGEDIAHLGELDYKKWTVLSCPIQGLEFDRTTLEMMDIDHDGRIHVKDVVAASQWLCSVIRDRDLILKGDSVLPLEQINDECEEGKRLLESAKHILKSLSKDSDEISVSDTSDSTSIFSGTRFNGDGIITPASADDSALQTIISACVERFPGLKDRSGEDGVDKDSICKFYDACSAYSEWMSAADSDREGLFPFGDSTPEAFAACNEIKDKVADFFLRCKLIRFNDAVSGAVDLSVDKIVSIADRNLLSCGEEIASCPLARPSSDCVLHLDSINPAWNDAVKRIAPFFPGRNEILEEDWAAFTGSLSRYSEWIASKRGGEVESLGIDYINAILSDGSKDALLDLVNQDAALKEQSESIDSVNKLTHYYRDLYHLLNNFVVFADFYGRNEKTKAVFEAGKLYIDQRCCNLCLKVEGSGNHAEAAALSGMFLIYCTCTSKVLGRSQDIVAVMTDGGVKNLRPGKNAIFYDLDGNDWDAVVTKIVDNPISIKQAFFSPYLKFWEFCVKKLNKSAADKESAVFSDMEKKADKIVSVPSDSAATPAKEKAAPFDIAKFAGIFAAIGLALGTIGDFLKDVVSGASANPLKAVIVLVGIILCISGPSCFIAWSKLRKRNIGPVLNANGWAINSLVLVNILFGATLTNVAKYPLVTGQDPFRIVVPLWKRILSGTILALIVAFGIMYFTDNLNFMGIHNPKAKAEESVTTSQLL